MGGLPGDYVAELLVAIAGPSVVYLRPGPEVITHFKLSSAEHELSNAHKYKIS